MPFPIRACRSTAAVSSKGRSNCVRGPGTAVLRGPAVQPQVAEPCRAGAADPPRGVLSGVGGRSPVSDASSTAAGLGPYLQHCPAAPTLELPDATGVLSTPQPR